MATPCQEENLQQYVNNFTVKPAYYEQKPRILNHLTYIKKSTNKDGEVLYHRLRLKAAHKEVYMVITEIAGDAACFRDIDYIANMANCSRDTVMAAKEVFKESFEQLGGGSLMTITEKRVMTTKIIEHGDSKNVNKRPVHICGIEWIWEYNNSFMAALTQNKSYSPPPGKQQITAKEAELVIEKMGQKGISEIVHNQGAESKNRFCPKAESKNRFCSPGGRVEKPTGHKTPKQNPFVKKQNPMAKAIHMSLINQKDVEECFSSEQKAVEFLEVLGFKHKAIFELFTKHNLYEMQASTFYMKQELEKRELKSSVSGYFLSILTNKWWMPKAS